MADVVLVDTEGDNISLTAGAANTYSLTDADAPTIVVTTPIKGDTGDTGLQGPKGDTGPAGADSTVPGPQGPQGNTGATGLQGIQGVKGDTGLTGATGPTGTAATIAVGSVTTGVAGSSASVTNSGTSSSAIFDITIPRGDTGVSGSGSGDVSSNTITSVDGEVVLFSGTAGKTLKRATMSGIPKLTSGVQGTATSGADYSAGTSALATGILKTTTTTGALSVAVAADFPTLNQTTTGTAAGITGKTTPTGALVGDTDTQTLTNKTATGLNLTAGTTTVAPLKIPNGTILTTPANGAVEADVSDLYFTNSTPTRFKVVMDTKAQTLTNKTLTAPVISSITNTGTLTLPTTSDTLVGKATTDTLTNKTLSSAVVSGQLTFSRAALTAATTLTTTSAILEDCDATTAAFTVTLPATTTAGVQFIIKKTDSSTNAVTVSGTAIEGGTTVILRSQYDFVHVVSTTTSGTWRVLDGIRPTAWITPTLNTGWLGWDAGGAGLYGFPQYMKDSEGFVIIRGLLKFTTGTATNANVMFTLPVGFRPFQFHRVLILSNDTASQIEIAANGNIYLGGNASVAVNNWVSLDGLSFRAEA